MRAREDDLALNPTQAPIGLCEQCGFRIGRDYPYSWCSSCGTALPIALNRQLTNPASQRAALTAETADEPRDMASEWWFVISRVIAILAGVISRTIAESGAAEALAWAAGVWLVLSGIGWLAMRRVRNPREFQ